MFLAEAAVVVEQGYPLISVASLVSLLTLTILEVVLGIDNIVFIAILSNKLPAHQQAWGRRIGLALAMLMRIALLFAITWVMTLDRTVLFEVPTFGLVPDTVHLEQPEATAYENANQGAATSVAVNEHPEPSDTPTTQPTTALASNNDAIPITGKRLILLLGGLFLLAKATWEIHDKLEGGHGHGAGGVKTASFAAVIVQILLLDAVFSIDSVITAVGIARHIEVMIAAVVIAVIVMLIFAGPVSRFIERHPTMKMLALAFLLLIGVLLVAEGVGGHIPKGYVYFAMAFALLVEMLNIRVRKTHRPVKLQQSYVESESEDGYGDMSGRGFPVTERS